MIPLALSVLGYGKMIAQAAISWLSKRSLIQILGLILGLALVFDHIALLSAHRHSRKVEAQLSKTVQARLNERAAYSKAQADAHVQNIVQVQRIEQQQQKVTDNVETRYRADLARLRAEQLRPSTPASPGAPGKPGSPAAAPAPGGPGCEAMPLSGPELLQAQETELQLNALIDWIMQQSAINPNKP